MAETLIRSAGISLKGDDTTLMFPPLREVHSESLSSSQVDHRTRIDTTTPRKQNMRSGTALNFMFDVWNSTFSAIGVHVICDSDNDGFCLFDHIKWTLISVHDRILEPQLGDRNAGRECGRNVVCVNSSFSHCIRQPNNVKDYANKNITQSVIGRLSSVASTVTSVSYTLCTFNTMTVAADVSYRGGAAICLSQTSSSLTVEQCFFHKCSCTGNNDDGGAICVAYQATKKLSISSIVTITSLSIVFSETQAVVTVSTESAIEGSMGILLDGSNVPRLVHVVFGARPLHPGQLKRLSPAIVGHKISFPPFVTQSEATLLNPNTTEIVVRGEGLVAGSYWMEVWKGTTKWNISLEFEDSTTLKGTAPLYPSDADGRLDYGAVGRFWEISSSGPIFDVTSTQFFVSFLIGEEENNTHVIFGGRYRVVSVGSGDEIVVNGNLFVDIPLPPTITKIVVPVSTSSSSFVLSVEGTDLPSGSTFVMVLNSSHSISVTFSSDSAGTSGSIDIGGTGQLKYNTEYTLSSVTRKVDGKEDELIFFSVSSFKTPSGPTLSSLSCSLDASDPDFFVLSLTTSLMPAEDFILVVTNTECSSDIVSITVPSASLGSGSFLVEVYNKSDTLRYDSSYSVSSMRSSASSVVAVVSAPAFVTPGSPARIVKVESELGSDSEKSAIVKLSGQERKKERHSEIWGEYTLTRSASSSNGFHVEPISVTVPILQSDKDGILILQLLNTTCRVSLFGSDLVVGSLVRVTLNSSLSFSASMTSETEGQSEELRIGWSDSLQFDTKYTMSSMTALDEEGSTLFGDEVSDTTGLSPTELFIFSDSGSSCDGSVFCGERSRACSSIGVGWRIVEGVGIDRVSFGIIDSSSLSSQIMVDCGMRVVVTNGSEAEPTLRIPSSASSSSSSAWSNDNNTAVIVIRESFFEIRHVNVVIDLHPSSFTLVSSTDSTIVLKDASLHGTAQLSSSSDNDICSWATGVLVLENSITTIQSTPLTQLSQGAINMKNGSLTLISPTFWNNSPNNPSFPSLRRNIRCSEGGTIEIDGRMNGGDRSKDDASAWISSDDCTITGDEGIARAPFFVPSLNTEQTSVKQTSDKIVISLVGTLLIPCGLGVEIREWDEKVKEYGKSAIADLTELNSTVLTETGGSVELVVSDLKKELD
ncbi:hypothetical protein BLNAU_23802 [Blattamonas nauphoetae]|uniref:Uncharacterized protein n=1 Tax=Blattamonas nauphoetae TaxID=2049346 RepID=A0ABQ9WP87_9EUKA|nr:hypothetical protein BLNAU_23802 [Blattamonas nauphoetae]